MTVWLRTFLVWWLVLALPVQGAMAATLARCGPNHAAAAVAVLPRVVQAETGVDPHGGHQGRAHEMHATETGHDAPTFKLTAADPHKCSACAACCSVAVIGNMIVDVPAPGISATAFIPVVPTVEKYSADGPDRPPRARVA